MKEILEKAENHSKLNLPFVIYSKPNSDMICGRFQQNDELFQVCDFTEKGFVFAGFDGSKAYYIPEFKSDVIFEKHHLNATKVKEKKIHIPDVQAKEDFENLVKNGISAIERNEFKKVVLSRKETIVLADFKLTETFEKLVYLYPSTFVYCFFHPKVGMWFGATPEQLVTINGKGFKTMALAGTQKDVGANDIRWPIKEQVEQQFVTDYIVEQVTEIAKDLIVSLPYSIKAGSVWHIKTDISGAISSDKGLKKIIQLLHPTPAVCGLPKNESKAFILASENYDRTFYTGYLGELNSNMNTDLFVNLRCMEIEISSEAQLSKANLYVGCGITKDSIPEKEWEESINKSNTMKMILDCRF